MNGKDDTKKLTNLSKNKWGGNHYLEALFLDFFKRNDSAKTEPSAKISSYKEKLGGWFNWCNEMYCGLMRFHWLAEPNVLEG